MDNVSVEKTKLDKIADSITTADGGGNMLLDDMPGRIGALGANNVKYIPQELTEGQKAQARGNISALPVGLGMADASVGDLLRVKTVDALGVPTALEPVSMEELEGKWELVEKIVLKEPATISVDHWPDGTPYSFKKMNIFTTVKTSSDVRGFFRFHDSTGYQIADGLQVYNKDQTYGQVQYDATIPLLIYWREGTYYDFDSTGALLFTGNSRWQKYALSSDRIIRKYSFDGTLPKGSVIEIWGVRA